MEAKGRTDGRFDGFGDRTRRELRAGLRLGEELAKRQQQHIGAHTSNLTPEVSSGSAEPEMDHEVHYPELGHVSEAAASSEADLAVHNAMEMQFNRSGKVNTGDGETIAKTPESTQVGKSGSNIEAISDNESDSSDDTEVDPDDVEESIENMEDQAAGGLMDETDIWQAEAKSLSRAADRTEAPGEVHATKSTRGRIPTPWKKSAQNGREVESAYADDGVEHREQGGKKRASPTLTSQSRKSQKRTPSTSPSATSQSSDDVEDEAAIEKGSIDDHEETESQENDYEVEEPEDDEAVDDEDENDVSDEDGDIDMDKGTTSSKSRSASPTNSTHSSRRILTPTSRHSCASTPKPAPEPTPRSEKPSFLKKLANFVFAPAKFGLGDQFTSLTTPQRTPAPKPKLTIYKPVHGPRIRHLSSRMSFYRRNHYSADQMFAMEQIYQNAKDRPDGYPFNPEGPAAKWRGEVLIVSGWKKRLADWELAVVDRFMDCMKVCAVEDGSSWSFFMGRVHFTYDDAIRMVMIAWAKQVMYEEVDIHDERAGSWDPDLLDTRERVLEKQRRWKEANGIVDPPAPWFSFAEWLHG